MKKKPTSKLVGLSGGFLSEIRYRKVLLSR